MKNQPTRKENPTAACGAGGSDTRYKGVRKRKWGKYVSEIRLPNCRERIWLGSYDSAEKAARAFDAAMFCLRGCAAKFNFPDDPPHIARAHSLSRSEIQEAAARFANEHPTSVTTTASTKTGDTNRTESPSDGTVQLDLMSDLGMLTPMGSGDYGNDYGFFPVYDDFCGEFYSPALTSGDVDYGMEDVDKSEPFLWNF